MCTFSTNVTVDKVANGQTDNLLWNTKCAKTLKTQSLQGWELFRSLPAATIFKTDIELSVFHFSVVIVLFKSDDTFDLILLLLLLVLADLFYQCKMNKWKIYSLITKLEQYILLSESETQIWDRKIYFT